MEHKLLCPTIGTLVVLSPFVGALIARLAVPGEPLLAALWGAVGLLAGCSLAAIACGVVLIRRELFSPV